MSERRWSEVDAYVEQTLIGEDPALEAATRASEAGGLPPIALTPAQGKLLHLLARMHGARSVLELGTLGGYSTIWLARALPADGRLITLELDPDYARVAAANIERAGLAGLVKIEVGPALEGLRRLVAESAGPFDLVFIDADKQRTPEYFELALELHASRQRDRDGQRRTRRRDRRCRQRRSGGAGHAALSRAARARTRGRPTRERDHDSDGRRQGLRRLHARARGAIGSRSWAQS